MNEELGMRNEELENAGSAQNNGLDNLNREDVRALAGEVLGALGVEKVEMDEEEREAVKRAVEAWRAAKDEGI